MAPPAQLSAEIDPDRKQNNRSFHGKGMRSIKSEDVIFEMENLSDEQPEPVEDVAANVDKFESSSDIRVPKGEDTDATEYSSSFADTLSENENYGLSDTGVESPLYGDNGFASTFDEFSNIFPMRKKRLTSHWRRFIHPLMWRCRLAELKIKQFGSQALKYDRQISALDQRKLTGLNEFTGEAFDSMLLPCMSQGCESKSMKRRKRKRVEDTIDRNSYFSNHNLFSYLGNKKSDPDGTSIADDLYNPVLAEEEQTTNGHDEFDINNHSSFLEDIDKSVEEMYWKIEILYSRVHMMKPQCDLIMSKNSGMFSSYENLSQLVPRDVQTSSVCSPTLSDFDLGDLMIPDSAVSSFGDAIDIPDIIESTVGLLSAAEVTQRHSQIGDSCDDIVDNILIHNQAAEVDTHTYKNGDEESTINLVLPKLESDTRAKSDVSRDQSNLKSRLPSDFQFPKNKRKRGERKAGMGNWSRQCPGEPNR